MEYLPKIIAFWVKKGQKPVFLADFCSLYFGFILVQMHLYIGRNIFPFSQVVARECLAL